MTHQATHTHLHDAVTELFMDFLKNNPIKRMTTTTMHDLLTWSSKQVDAGPDHPEVTVTRRRAE
jgi:hypothetical protein